MVKTVKNNIGIAVIGEENKIGPIIVAAVVIDNSFIRQNMSNFNAGRIDQLVPKFKFWKYELIKPEEIDSPEAMLSSTLLGIINCLNTYPEFWKHNITIENKAYEQTLTALYPELLPHGLKKLNLTADEFKFNSKAKNVMCAQMVAKEILIKELKKISDVYGDITNQDTFIEQNKDCVHIRPWRNLK